MVTFQGLLESQALYFSVFCYTDADLCCALMCPIMNSLTIILICICLYCILLCYIYTQKLQITCLQFQVQLKRIIQEGMGHQTVNGFIQCCRAMPWSILLHVYFFLHWYLGSETFKVQSYLFPYLSINGESRKFAYIQIKNQFCSEQTVLLL